MGKRVEHLETKTCYVNLETRVINIKQFNSQLLPSREKRSGEQDSSFKIFSSSIFL